MNTRITDIIKGGLIATAAMTLLMVLAPMMGMPKMPVGNMLAGFMHIPVALGWVAHFMIGTMLAAGYVLVFEPMLGGGAAKGAFYSLIPFLMAQLVVMPMMGAGLFSSNTPAPVLMVMGSLMGHLVYGVVLGLVVQGSRQTATA
ncbi:MAG: hypothetical protein Kow0042_26740 [Calditrichia bacterium]